MGPVEVVTFQRVAPMLLVENVDEAVAWYEGVLGAKLQYGLPRTPPLEWASVLLGDVEIMFSRRDVARQWYSKEARIAESPANFIAFVYVRGVGALYDRVKDRVKIIMEPPNRSYGMTEFAIEDPSGFMLTFAEVLGN